MSGQWSFKCMVRLLKTIYAGLLCAAASDEHLVF